MATETKRIHFKHTLTVVKERLALYRASINNHHPLQLTGAFLAGAGLGLEAATIQYQIAAMLLGGDTILTFLHGLGDPELVGRYMVVEAATDLKVDYVEALTAAARRAPLMDFIGDSYGDILEGHMPSPEACEPITIDSAAALEHFILTAYA